MTKLTMDNKINGESVSELKNNGYFDQGGKNYVLLQQAYIDGPWDDAAYFSTAVRIGDEIIDGEVKTYKVEWEISNPKWKEAEDESYNCDWENPVSVKEYDAIEVTDASRTECVNGSADPFTVWYEESGHIYFADTNDKFELTELPDKIYWDNDNGYYLLEDGRSLDAITKD